MVMPFKRRRAWRNPPAWVRRTRKAGIANDTPYGLTNYVQSTDDARRNRIARRLRSGMVEMNGQPRGAGSPFGGMKASGNGRKGGVWGLEEFLEIKAVSGWAGNGTA
jgi:aldehyde dehydrogenase (NAD+)